MNKPKISSYLIGGRRKLFWNFNDGSEMIEEYVIDNHELISRIWKTKGKLNNFESVEIGIPN